jgi:hypothetical protein
MSLQELLDQIDEFELRQEFELRRYRKLLIEHPHCADEGHPGCSQCYDEEEGER